MMIRKLNTSFIFKTLRACVLGAGMFLFSFARLHAAQTTLNVVDGYNAAGATTLSASGEAGNLNLDDDANPSLVIKGTNLADNGWIGINFTQNAVPTGNTITQVVIEFEQQMAGNATKTGTLYLDVSTNPTTTNWSDGSLGNEAGQGTNNQTFAMTGSNNYTFESYDISSIVTSLTELNNLEILFRNDAGSFKDVNLDFVRVVVTYFDQTPPDAVNDLNSQIGTNPGDVTLTWTATGDHGATGTLNSSTFSIQYALSSGVSWSSTSAQVTITTTAVNPGDPQFTDLTLDPNSTYYFRLWTTDDSGNASAQSNLTSTVTLANAVSGVGFSAVYQTSATVTWSALPASPSSSSANGYLVEASSTNFDGSGTIYSNSTSNGTDSSILISSLDHNTTYFFRVGSLNWAGAVTYQTPVSSATKALIPSAAGTTFTDVGVSSIAVQWADGGNQAGTRYFVEISDDGFGTVLTSSTTTNLSVLFGTGGEGSALAANTTHQVRVAALNHNDALTPYLTLGSTATLADSPAAAGTTFSTVGQTSMTVTWTAGSNPGGTSYSIQISSDGFGTIWAETQTTNLTHLFGSGGAGSDLLGNTTYTARVNAINHNNVETNFAALGSTSTLAKPVTDLSFFDVYTTSAGVQWTSPVDGAQGFNLELSSTNFDGTGTTISSVSASGADTQLIAFSPALITNTTYYARVGAVNHNDVTTYAGGLSTSTLADPPVSPSVASVYVTSASVSWTLPSGTVTAFRAEASQQSDFTGLVLSSTTGSGTETSLTVEGLNSDTTYYFRVASLNWNSVPNFTQAGSTQTNTSEDTIPPATINNLSLSTVSATSMRLDWTGVFDPTDVPLSGNYAIQYATYSGVTWSTTSAQIIFSTTTVSNGDPQYRIVNGLNPNSTYYFRIWTSDLKPNWSDPSNTASEMTLALKVSGTSVSAASTGTLTVSWTALPSSPSTGSANGYLVQASSTNFNGTGSVLSSQTANGTASSLIVSGLLSNTTYAVRVGALNFKNVHNFAASASSPTWAQPVSFGSPFTAVNQSSVSVAWTALPSSPSEDSSSGYLLQASSTNFSGAGTLYSSRTTSVSLSTLSLTGLSLNTTYYFRVGSLNWAGAANFALAGSTTTLTGSPSNLQVTAKSTGTVSLQWTASSGSPDFYRLEASLDSGFSSLETSSDTSTGGETSLTLVNLLPNTTYFIRVGAANKNGALNYGPALSTSTLANAPDQETEDFLAVYQSSVSLQWQALPATPSSASAAGYIAQASTDSGFGGTIYSSQTVNGSASSLIIQGLSLNTSYFFRVGSLNWNGESHFTTLSSTPTLTAPPDAGAAAFSGVFPSSLTVSWGANGNAAGTVYAIEASTSAGFETWVSSGETTSLSLQMTGLSPNQLYYFRAFSENHAGVPSAFVSLGSTATASSPPGATAPVFTPVGQSSVTVNYTDGDPANPAGTEYLVEISTLADFSVVQTSQTTNLSAVFQSLSINTSYYARALAYNQFSVPSAYTSFGSTSTLAVQPGPAVSTFTSLTNSGFVLNWSSGTSGAGYNSSGTTYRAQVALDSLFSSVAAEQTATGLSVTFDGLVSGTQYWVRVRAENLFGITTEYVEYGSTTTLPSSIPTFKAGTFEITNASGTYISNTLYTNTTTVNARVNIQSNVSPGLAVSDTPSMLAIWNFDEGSGTTVRDASRHGRQLTLQGTPNPSWVTGHSGSALDFDGANNYAIGTTVFPWRSAGNNSWTMELWFKATNNDDKGYLIQTANSAAAGGSHDGAITWDTASGNLMLSLKFNSGNPNNTADAISSSAYDDSQWHYAAAVLNASGAYLYVDGVAVATTTAVNSTTARQYTTGNDVIWIGAGTTVDADQGQGIRFYSGLIDNVRLSTVPLSAAQIAENYAISAKGIRFGGPDAERSTQGGSDFTWTKISTTNITVTGTNGTLAEQTFTISNIPVIQSASPGALTNQLYLLGSDLNSGVEGEQYTILVDTTPPTNVGISSFTTTGTHTITATALSAADSLSGLATLPYNLEASTDNFSTILASSNYQAGRNFSFTGLSANTTHQFRVRVKDTAGNESNYSSLASTSTLANAVSGQSVFSVYETSATVAWTPLPASPVSATSEGYRLEASSTNFNGTGTIYSSATTDAAEGTLTVPGLVRNKIYYFRVGSLNWNNAANIVSAGSTRTLTALPINPAWTSVQASSAVVAWTVPSTAPAGFRLEASTHSDFSSAVYFSSTTNGLSTSLTLLGLTPFTTYYFRAGSLNADNRANYVLMSATSTRTNAPTGASFQNVFPSSVTASWTAPSGGANGFRLEASTAANFTGTLFSSSTADGGQTTLTVSGLSPNTTYYLRTSALDWNEKTRTTVIGGTATLANIAVSPTFSNVYISSAALSWTPPSGTVVSFRVEASTAFDFSGTIVSSQTGTGSENSLTVQGLTSNQEYFFRIASLNWNNAANYVSAASTTTRPAAPTAPLFTDVFISSAALSWTGSSGGAFSYRLEASAANDFNSIEASSTTLTGETNATLTGLSSNTTYFFRVLSLNSDSQGTPSSILSTSTLANPPTTLTFPLVAFTSATVSWTAPTGGAAGFILEASTASDFTGTIESSQTADTGALSLSILSLSANTTYYFRTASLNWNGVPTYSLSLATSTLAGPPENVQFTNVFISSATLNWTAPSGGTNGYTLQASTHSDFSAAVVSSDTTDAGALSLTVSSLEPNTTTYFRVGSINSNDEVVFASSLSTSTLANTPGVFAIGTVSTGSIQTSWTAPSGGAAGFLFEASPNADFSSPVTSSQTTDSNSTGLTVNGLDANTTYYLRVGALNWNAVPTYTTTLSTSSLSQQVTRISPDVLQTFESSVTVRWDALPSSPANQTSEGYRLEGSSTNFTDGTVYLSSTSAVAESTLTLTGLDANTTYYFRVGSLNWNNAANFVTLDSTSSLAGQPVSPSFAASYVSSVTVQWTAPSGGAEGYWVEASTASDFSGTLFSSQTAAGTETTLTVQSLLSDTIYHFRVASLNWNESLNYSIVGSTQTEQSIDPTGPDSVNDLTATTLSSTTIRLDWSAPSDATDNPLDGTFLIQYSTDSGVSFSTDNAQISISTVGVTPASAQFRTVQNLWPNSTYFFRLWTQDARPNTSPISNGATVATLAKVPQNLQFVSVFESSASVSWTAFAASPSSAAAEGFLLQASTASNFSGSLISSQSATSVENTLTLTTLDPNTTYFYRVGSLNWVSSANYSAASSTSTLAIKPVRLASDFVSISTESIQVQWSAFPVSPSSATSQGYVLQASTGSFESGSVILSSETTLAADASLSLSSLSPNTTYFFRVGSRNWNDKRNFTILDTTATLSKEPGVGTPAFTPVGVTSVTANWTLNGNPSGTLFEVELSSEAGFGSLINSSTSTALSSNFSGLNPNTTYYARVRSYNWYDEPSAYTSLGSTVTLASVPTADGTPFSNVERSSFTLAFSSGSPSNPSGTTYIVEWSSSGSFSWLSSTTQTGLTYTPTNLRPNTTYYARASAFNHLGVQTSYLSIGSTATLAATPGGVVSTFTSVQSRSFTINWSSGAGSLFNPTGTTYEVDLSTEGSFASQVGQQSITDLFASFSGLDSGTTYYARVRAYSHSGNYTPYHDLGSVTTLETSEPQFDLGTLQVTDSNDAYQSITLYTDTTTVKVKVDVRSLFSPGLAITAPESTKALWNLDETNGTTGNDSSFHGNTLALQGAPPPSWVAGHTGQALQTDGSQNYAVSVNLTPWRSSAGNNSWTVSMWFKTTTNSGYLFQAANKNTSPSFSFDLDIGWDNTNGYLAAALRTSGGSQKIAYSTSSHADGSWQHVAARLNSSSLDLFVNGTKMDTNTEITASSAKTYATAIYAWIGNASTLDANIGNGSQYANAAVDDVLISTAALTDEQILKAYSLGALGHKAGAPRVGVSTQSGAAYTWIQLSTDAATLTGSDGSTSFETFEATGIELVETASPGADTNKIAFISASLDGLLTTTQATILVDTTPPTNVGVSALSNISSSAVTVDIQTAVDALSGLAALPYNIEVSTDQAFTTILSSTGKTASTQATFSGLDPNTTYYFRTNAEDAVGHVSAYSSVIATPTLALPLSDPAIQTVYVSSITVGWTPLAVSPSSSTSEGYRVDASTAGDFTGTLFTISTDNASVTELTVPGLSFGVTYYFRAGTLNWTGVPNYQTAGSTVIVDSLPPDPITNLSALSGTSGGAIDLSWTSPGDDGLSGTLTGAYIIQYTTDTAFGSWDPEAAQPSYVYRFNISTSGVNAGEDQAFTLSGLISEATYFFRAWTQDEENNISELSNGATAQAAVVNLSVSLSTDTLIFGTLAPGSTTLATTSITVTNDGNLIEHIAISLDNPTVWTATTSAAGTNTFRLTGLFSDTQPSLSDFDESDDVIMPSTTTATSSIFAITANSDSEKGISVPPGETRTLWIRIEMPIISGTDGEQVIRLNATAIKP